MFTVNNQQIMADEVRVVEELRRQAAINGLQRFRTIRRSGDNVVTCCPFHKDGQERHASFLISSETSSCYCFACGWEGSIDEMISKLFGFEDSGAFGKRWLLTNFDSHKGFFLEPGPKVSTSKDYFTPAELKKYQFIHPYMYERKLNDTVIKMFEVGFDTATQCITFPVYDEDGYPAFIARRSVKSKFFSYPKDAKKPVYAANIVKENNHKVAVVAESIFNCLTCWRYGIPAVALLGLGTPHQYEILKRLPVRKYITAFDPDVAGERATEKFKKALGRSKVITSFVLPDDKDLNDLDGAVLNLKEYF